MIKQWFLIFKTVWVAMVPTEASGEGPVRKSSNPFIIQEPLVSPGWTLAVTTTARFAWGGKKGREGGGREGGMEGGREGGRKGGIE